MNNINNVVTNYNSARNGVLQGAFLLIILSIQTLSMEASSKLSNTFDSVKNAFTGGYYSSLSNVNKVGKYGLTLLESAIKSNNFTQVQNLISQKADVNMANNNGRAALHVAVDGANYCSPSIIKYLIDHNADIDMQDDFGMTPLQIAAKALNYDAVELLIEAHAHLDMQDKAGDTALINALRKGLINDERMRKDQIDIIIALIDAGANVNIPCNDNRRPLQVARHQIQYFGMDSIVEQHLLAAGASAGDKYYASEKAMTADTKSVASAVSR